MSDYDWRWENSILQNKKYLQVEGVVEYSYNPWRTNSTLSNYYDTIAVANIMNCNPHLDHKLQYDYLYLKVKKEKRWFKKKKAKKDEVFTLVQNYYKYNNVRTKEALKILTKEQIDVIRKEQEKGGIT
jgi:hypothetical protein